MYLARNHGGTMAEFDPLRILAALRSHGVNYVLVGGLAAAAHGSPLETDDVDVCLAPDDENLDRLGLSLLDLGADPVPDDTGDADRVSFNTTAGRLDCLELGGRYSELSWNATDIDVGRGLNVRVADLKDLTELQRSAGDLRAAAHLASLVDAPAEPDAVETEEHFVEAKPEGKGWSWGAKLMTKLERVDTWLTDLNNGELHKRKAS
jgi:hypothetical protein